MKKLLPIAILATQVGALPASADDGVALGSFVGTHIFSPTLELGVVDSASSDSPRNSIALGIRAGYPLVRFLSVEGELAVMPTRTRASKEDVTVIGWRMHALVDLAPDDRVRPFAVLGLGFLTLSPSNLGALDEDTDLTAHLGLGLEFDLSPHWALRSDARVVFAPTSSGDSLTRDMEFFVGAVRRFGSAGYAEPSDGDGDGVFDPQDLCPLEKEDQDGFADEDGCPDPDNDLDGVPDQGDQCPAEAESANGIDDEDGCPESDGDGDGVLGSQDLCPQEAEDLDGVDDGDGCPDVDPVPEAGLD